MAMVGDLQSHERGFHAITARIANRAIPLRIWLAGDATIDRARDMAEVVLLEQLEPFYREDGRSKQRQANGFVCPRGGSCELWLPSRAIRTRLMIRAARMPNCRDLMERLNHFVTGDYATGNLGNLGRKVLHVRIFGDLHSGNILVQPSVSPRPVLIDASLYSSGHWSSDNARLLVDLLLRVRKSGVESMLWPDTAIVEAQLPQLCPYCEASVALNEWEEGPTDAFMARAVQLLPRQHIWINWVSGQKSGTGSGILGLL